MKKKKRFYPWIIFILCILSLFIYVSCGDGGVEPPGGNGGDGLFIPNAPSDLTCTAVSISQIDLLWVVNSDNEDGFKIERRKVGESFSLIYTTGANETSYSDIGLEANTTYYYRVRAYNTAGDSAYSNEVLTATQAAGSSEKDITAFNFYSEQNSGEGITDFAVGAITGTNISVLVPYNTDITGLIATFITTGASVQVGITIQVSGTTANDFTNPVTYTVTAEDDTTKDYTVTVILIGISGSVWTEREVPGAMGPSYWSSITSSADGTRLAAVGDYGCIYTSTDSGANWTERTSAGSRIWLSITSSADGTKLTAGDLFGYIYTSTDSGASWTERTSAGRNTGHSITSSADGTKLAAVDSFGYIYTSTDSGSSWTENTSAGERNWRSITSSADGT